jgi:hypothetical protein
MGGRNPRAVMHKAEKHSIPKKKRRTKFKKSQPSVDLQIVERVARELRQTHK